MENTVDGRTAATNMVRLKSIDKLDKEESSFESVARSVHLSHFAFVSSFSFYLRKILLVLFGMTVALQWN